MKRRYRKIDPRIWNDAKFMALDDRGKLLFLFLLTHPNQTALGAMRATLAGLGAELGWDTETVTDTVSILFRNGMVDHDERVHFVALPHWFTYNPPENPNVVASWWKALDLIPECDGKTAMIQRATDCAKGLGEPYGKRLPEPFRIPYRKGMAIQEQEQEQEQERASPPAQARAREGAAPPPDDDDLKRRAQEFREWFSARGMSLAATASRGAMEMYRRLAADPRVTTDTLQAAHNRVTAANARPRTPTYYEPVIAELLVASERDDPVTERGTFG